MSDNTTKSVKHDDDCQCDFCKNKDDKTSEQTVDATYGGIIIDMITGGAQSLIMGGIVDIVNSWLSKEDDFEAKLLKFISDRCDAGKDVILAFVKDKWADIIALITSFVNEYDTVDTVATKLFSDDKDADQEDVQNPVVIATTVISLVIFLVNNSDNIKALLQALRDRINR